MSYAGPMSSAGLWKTVSPGAFASGSVSLPAAFLRTADNSLSHDARLSGTIDARHFGVDFSGADVDNGPKWTNFINACRRNRRRGVCPGGRSIVKTTITTDYGAQGVVIEGGGRGDTGTGLHVGTELVWAGTMGAGTTLLQLDGNLGWTFRGLRFKGAITDDAATGSRVESLIAVDQTSTQVGAGTHHFSDCNFRDADYGLRYGALSTNNTDSSLIDMVYAKNLGCFFSAENNQALGFVFNLLFLSSCKACLRFINNSGHFVVNGLYPTSCGGTGADEWIVDLQGGTNGWAGVINDYRLETGCRQAIRVIKDGHLIVNNLTEVATADAILLYKMLGGSIEINGGKMSSRDTAVTTQPWTLDLDTGRSPRVNIRDVTFAPTVTLTDFIPQEWFKLGSANVIPDIEITGCMEYTTRSEIPNWGTRAGRATGSVMRAATTSTGGNTAELSHFAASTSTYYNQPKVTSGTYDVVIVGRDNTASQTVKARFIRRLDIDLSGSSQHPAIINTETVGTDYNPSSITAPSFIIGNVAAGKSANFDTLRITVTALTGTALTWSAHVRRIAHAGPRLVV